MRFSRGGGRAARRLADRPGFTLVELVAVLLILAILATVALEMVEPQVDQTRFETTQKTLRSFEHAIYAEKINADGSTTTAGFFVDMGGVPRANAEIDDAGFAVLTVRSLWEIPTGVLPYENRNVLEMSTVIANTDNTLDGNSDGEDDDLDGDPVNGDSEVIVGTGWRGPYLKLPIGANGIKDAWGSSLVTYTAVDPNTDYPYVHLRGSGDIDVTGAGQDVYGIRSLGRDDKGDDLFAGDTYDRDLPALTAALPLSIGSLFGPVVGTVSVDKDLDGDSSVAVFPTNVVVQLYYPDRETGKVRIERATIYNARFDSTTERDLFDYKFEIDDGMGGTATLQFPVGPRVVRAYYDANDDTGDFSDELDAPTSKSRIEYKSITAHTNRIDLMLN